MIFLASAVVLGRRLLAVDTPRRRVLAPLIGYGLLAVTVQPLALTLLPRLGVTPYYVGVVQVVVLAGVPFAFVLSLLLGGFARTLEIQELGAWLGRAPGSHQELRDAVAHALGDPTVELWFWVRGHYVDADGTAVQGQAGRPDRGLVEVAREGERLGAISYDATLITQPTMVEAAGRVIALALERERLTAELLAVRASLRKTLMRLVESGDIERRKLARDLHDGLQSYLVLLGIGAQQIHHDPTASPSVQDAATQLRDGIGHSIDELRALVAGVMPATLMERGLYAATEDFVQQIPIPTTLDTSGPESQLPSAVEGAAYFVITEAVTNALKHAHATTLAVGLDHHDDRLFVSVTDDGVGGANGANSGGLTGLADRIGALGGRFDVQSQPGQGTRLTAEVPCGSSEAKGEALMRQGSPSRSGVEASR